MLLPFFASCIPIIVGTLFASKFAPLVETLSATANVNAMVMHYAFMSAAIVVCSLVLMWWRYNARQLPHVVAAYWMVMLGMAFWLSPILVKITSLQYANGVMWLGIAVCCTLQFLHVDYIMQKPPAPATSGAAENGGVS